MQLTKRETKIILNLFGKIEGVYTDKLNFIPNNSLENADIWIRVNKAISEEFIKLNTNTRVINSKSDFVYIGIVIDLENVHNQINSLRGISNKFLNSF